jgi:outer membrane protein assembly factor BamB
MYRRGNDDVVIALEAATGKTHWEHAMPAPHQAGMAMEHGPGPHSTPLLAGDRLFVVSITGRLECLDKRTGKPLWAHDLWTEYGGTLLNRGYAASPVAYRDLVIVPVGGKGHAVMAFRQADGKVAWKAQDFENTGSSPTLIDVGGLDQLVVFMAEEVAGLNPLNGDLQWRVPHRTDWNLNISMPVYGKDGILFISSAYGSGSQGIQLTRAGTGVAAKPIWKSNRMRIHHGNAIRIGEAVYGSSGDFGPAPLSAIDVKTGKMLWQDRGMSKANFVYADGKLIGLDEEGNLGMVEISASGGKLLAKSQVFQGRSWTAPTLVGSVLYARDRKMIAAFDLQ